MLNEDLDKRLMQGGLFAALVFFIEMLLSSLAYAQITKVTCHCTTNATVAIIVINAIAFVGALIFAYITWRRVRGAEYARAHVSDDGFVVDGMGSD